MVRIHRDRREIQYIVLVSIRTLVQECPSAFAPFLNVISAALDLDDEEDSDLDEDHRLLLQSSLPLLRSRNSAVVLAVCSLHYYCGVASIKVRLQLFTLLWTAAVMCSLLSYFCPRYFI